MITKYADVSGMIGIPIIVNTFQEKQCLYVKPNVIKQYKNGVIIVNSDTALLKFEKALDKSGVK